MGPCPRLSQVSAERGPPSLWQVAPESPPTFYSCCRPRSGPRESGAAGESSRPWGLFFLLRVFFLNVPLDSILERLTLRRIDPVTGERFVPGSSGWSSVGFRGQVPLGSCLSPPGWLMPRGDCSRGDPGDY